MERVVISENLTFGTVFNGLIEHIGEEGICARLPQWTDDMWLKIQMPDEHSKMTIPYLYAEVGRNRVPWFPSNGELFSLEWQLVSINK